MARKILSRKGICEIHGWGYSNFCQHLNGKTARQSTAKKYADEMGGDWRVWVTGEVEDRVSVWTKYLSRQVGK